jgi:hypothetical protein
MTVKIATKGENVMTKKAGRLGLYTGVIVAALAVAPAAQAQLTINSTQTLARVMVGNGSEAHQPNVVNVPTSTQPLIGIGALSPGHHSGSLATVSLLNTGRLLGVDVGGGNNAKTSIDVPNPIGKPILAP